MRSGGKGGWLMYNMLQFVRKCFSTKAEENTALLNTAGKKQIWTILKKRPQIWTILKKKALEIATFGNFSSTSA